AVKCDFMVPYVPKRFAECVQKECAEQNCGRGLIDAADRLHRETHHQCRRADDQTTTHEDAATPAMPAKMPSTNRRAELQGAEQHEKKSRDNMRGRQDRMAGKNVIQRNKLRCSRIGCSRYRNIPAG